AANVGKNLKLHHLTAMVALSGMPIEDVIRKTVVITHERFPHSSVQPLGFDSELIATLFPKAIPNSIRQWVARRAYGFFLQTEDGSDSRNQVWQSSLDSLPVLDYEGSRLPEAAAEHRSFTRAFQRSLLRARLLGFTRRIGLNGTAHACGSLVAGKDP